MEVELFGYILTWKHLAATAASLIVPPVLYLMHSGICQRIRAITCRRPVYGKMRIAYKVTTGDYCSRGGADSFKEIRKIHPELSTIGIYYDDPVQYDKTSRYIAGVVLCEGDGEADPKVEQEFQQLGYHMFTLPEVATAVQTSFPITNNLSPGIGGWKAYPAITKYIKENMLRLNPAVEIYEKNQVFYMVPQTDGDKFWVPEVERSSQKEKDL